MKALGFRRRGQEFYKVTNDFRLSLRLSYPRKGTTRLIARIMDEVELVHIPSENLYSAIWPLANEADFPIRQLGKWYSNSMMHLLPEAPEYPLVVLADHPVDQIADFIGRTFRQAAIPAMEALIADPTFPLGVLVEPCGLQDIERQRFLDESAALWRGGASADWEADLYRYAEHPNPLVREHVLKSLQMSILGGRGVHNQPPGQIGRERRFALMLQTFDNPNRLVSTLRRLALTDTCNSRQALGLLSNWLGKSIEDDEEPQLQVWEGRRFDLHRFDGTTTSGTILCAAESREHAARKLEIDAHGVRPTGSQDARLFARLSAIPFAIWRGDSDKLPVWHAEKPAI